MVGYKFFSVGCDSRAVGNDFSPVECDSVSVGCDFRTVWENKDEALRFGRAIQTKSDYCGDRIVMRFYGSIEIFFCMSC